MRRPSREECLMETAKIWAKRGTCPRANVGTVIEKEGRIISLGYVGSPPGEGHCLDVGCLYDERISKGCLRTIHAEANSLIFAAKFGISTLGARMFTTVLPCYKCSQLIIASGIKKVYFLEDYREHRGWGLLMDNSVEVINFKRTLEALEPSFSRA